MSKEKLSNWEKSKVELNNAGIVAFDSIPKDIIDFLNTKIDKNNPNNKNLAGHLKEEYNYTNIPDYVSNFICSKVNHPILSSIFKKIKILTQNKPIILDDLWINFQKKYEFNPLHDHSGLFSFIIFLKIPYDFEEEIKYFANTSFHGNVNSTLGFVFPAVSGELLQLNVAVDKSFENKMIMFSSKMQHMVYPFYTSDDYRITVSGNIKFLV